MREKQLGCTSDPTAGETPQWREHSDLNPKGWSNIITPWNYQPVQKQHPLVLDTPNSLHFCWICSTKLNKNTWAIPGSIPSKSMGLKGKDWLHKLVSAVSGRKLRRFQILEDIFKTQTNKDQKEGCLKRHQKVKKLLILSGVLFFCLQKCKTPIEMTRKEGYSQFCLIKKNKTREKNVILSQKWEVWRWNNHDLGWYWASRLFSQTTSALATVSDHLLN